MGQGRRSGRKSSPIAEIDVLWLTAGLGCDGDTIAMTAATQPSIEAVSYTHLDVYKRQVQTHLCGDVLKCAVVQIVVELERLSLMGQVEIAAHDLVNGGEVEMCIRDRCMARPERRSHLWYPSLEACRGQDLRWDRRALHTKEHSPLRYIDGRLKGFLRDRNLLEAKARN